MKNPILTAIAILACLVLILIYWFISFIFTHPIISTLGGLVLFILFRE